MLRHFPRSVHMSPDDHAYAPASEAKNKESGIAIVPSVCPHDCTSTCALDVERLSKTHIGRVRGSQRNDYTAGVICEKVARYAERIHHPDRLTKPLRRIGPKGSKQFAEISWSDALDIVAEQFIAKARQHGSETIWPYYYAGTMGLVQRDGINRLRHEMKYSRWFSTICVTLADTGWIAGTGVKRGADVREIGEHSDLVVIWGGNPVNTQVNVMTHAMKYTDAPDELAAHVATRTPEWASKITGLAVDEIVAFARMYGQAKAPFIRCHHGFSRSRNGAHNMHAVSSLPAVTGAWKAKGGGALYGHTGMYPISKKLIEGTDMVDTSLRELDQSRLGPILVGEADALKNGPPVTGLLIQNTNPAMVCPELEKVHKGFSREDLFTCVHEQFLTETAAYADIVLPATMFLEHDDFYTASGHTFFQVTKAVIDPPSECRENHYVISELAKRLGAKHRAYDMTAWEIMDESLKASGMWDAETNWRKGGQDFHLGFETSHFLDGFVWPDKKFRFKPDWAAYGPRGKDMPSLPDHFDVIDNATADKPFRLVAAPARTFLNSTFTETPSSQKREVRPTAMMNPDDCTAMGVADGDRVEVGNERGKTIVHAKAKSGQQKGVVVVEGIWPNRNFETGIGINAVTSADPGWPHGGAVFHDTAVWIRKLA